MESYFLILKNPKIDKSALPSLVLLLLPFAPGKSQDTLVLLIWVWDLGLRVPFSSPDSDFGFDGSQSMLSLSHGGPSQWCHPTLPVSLVLTPTFPDSLSTHFPSSSLQIVVLLGEWATLPLEVLGGK